MDRHSRIIQNQKTIIQQSLLSLRDLGVLSQSDVSFFSGWLVDKTNRIEKTKIVKKSSLSCFEVEL